MITSGGIETLISFKRPMTSAGMEADPNLLIPTLYNICCDIDATDAEGKEGVMKYGQKRLGRARDQDGCYSIETLLSLANDIHQDDRKELLADLIEIASRTGKSPSSTIGCRG